MVFSEKVVAIFCREKCSIEFVFSTFTLCNITIEFMFVGINMFWARLRLILARAAINITLEGIEKIKTEKNDNKTLRRIFFSPAL